jgi:hypothetical protein
MDIDGVIRTRYPYQQNKRNRQPTSSRFTSMGIPLFLDPPSLKAGDPYGVQFGKCF